jgi:hypothetical protein
MTGIIIMKLPVNAKVKTDTNKLENRFFNYRRFCSYTGLKYEQVAHLIFFFRFEVSTDLAEQFLTKHIFKFVQTIVTLPFVNLLLTTFELQR